MPAMDAVARAERTGQMGVYGTVNAYSKDMAI